MFGDEYKIDLYFTALSVVPVTMLLHITIEDIEELIMNRMKILTHDKADFLGFDRNNINNLTVDFVPNDLGITSEKRHIHLVMDVTDTVGIGLLVGGGFDFLVVLQLRGTVGLEHIQYLGIFPHPHGPVDNDILGRVKHVFTTLGITFFEGFVVVFEMSLIELHGVYNRILYIMNQNVLCVIRRTHTILTW